MVEETGEVLVPESPRERGNFVFALRVFLLLLVFVLPLAFIVAGLEYALRAAANLVSTSVSFLDSTQELIFQSGLLAGFSFFLLFVVTLLLPILWRHASWEQHQYKIAALIAVQCYALGFGLIFPVGSNFGWFIAFLLSLLGSLSWFTWQRRWRGQGPSPSPLSGIIRPQLHPGHIWYAYIPGAKEGKVRPVIVLKQADHKYWLVAYFTTHEPKEFFSEEYVEVPTGTVRGITRQSWIHISDLRVIPRKRFRVYVGPSPTALYARVCSSVRVTPQEEAITINEEKAGEVRGPAEQALRKTLGVPSFRAREGNVPVPKGREIDQAAWLFITELVRSLKSPHAPKRNENTSG